MSVINGDPPEYLDPSRPTSQGHLTDSRSLEPTRIYRLPMTSY